VNPSSPFKPLQAPSSPFKPLQALSSPFKMGFWDDFLILMA